MIRIDRRIAVAAAVVLTSYLTVTTAASAQKVGKPALSFAGTTDGGETIALEDLRGKVVVLDFWASWCGPCLEEMPFLIELYNELADPDLRIVAINVDENPADMKAFVDGLKVKPPFPILLDSKGAIAGKYNLPGMPTTVFLDGDGVVRYLHSGFKAKDREEYRVRLAELLGRAG